MGQRFENLEQFAIDVILERRHGVRASVLRVILYVLSLVYERLVQLRLTLYRRRIFRERTLGCGSHDVGNMVKSCDPQPSVRSSGLRSRPAMSNRAQACTEQVCCLPRHSLCPGASVAKILCASVSLWQFRHSRVASPNPTTAIAAELVEPPTRNPGDPIRVLASEKTSGAGPSSNQCRVISR